MDWGGRWRICQLPESEHYTGWTTFLRTPDRRVRDGSTGPQAKKQWGNRVNLNGGSQGGVIHIHIWLGLVALPRQVIGRKISKHKGVLSSEFLCRLSKVW